jgi:tetratricopeptide (TPR) repeat protein
MRGPHSTVVLALGLAASLVAPPLWAQAAPATPPAAPATPTAAELSTARKLFADGLKAEDRADWAEALAIFERVKAIAVSPALYYHLAVCHEELGHLVEALNAFEIALQEAERKHVTEVLEEASLHIKQIRPRIAELTITLPAGAEDVRIALDKKPVSAALAGTAMLIDPGAHHVLISASNYDKPFEATLTTRPGEAQRLSADLGARKAAQPAAPAAPDAPAQAAPNAAAAPPAGTLAPGPRNDSSAALSPLDKPPDRRPVYIAGGVSVALGGGALITGLVAHSQYTAFREQNENPAPGSFASRKALHDSGQALAVTSTVLTGAALIGGGVTAFLFLRGPGARPSTMAWSPWVTRQSAGVALGGAL